ncbi:MAG: hypothetical protein P4M12_02430 [Gammaproteobacteria bacterium]|nr:hypothetical protein [Gammaproteobacteria bacterium]
MKILSDINLSNMSFNKLGRGVEFKFLDMQKGEPISNIQCNAVYLFNYHNTFSEDDGFACYIVEIECTLIPHDSVNKWLANNNFGFMDMNGGVYVPSKKDLIHLHIESGDIVIDLACEEIIKDGIKLTL